MTKIYKGENWMSHFIGKNKEALQATARELRELADALETKPIKKVSVRIERKGDVYDLPTTVHIVEIEIDEFKQFGDLDAQA